MSNKKSEKVPNLLAFRNRVVHIETLQSLCHDRRHHGADIASKGCQFLYGAGSKYEILGVGGHEEGLDLLVEPFIQYGKLELEGEILYAPDAAQEYFAVMLLGEVHDKRIAGVQ